MHLEQHEGEISSHDQKGSYLLAISFLLWRPGPQTTEMPTSWQQDIQLKIRGRVREHLKEIGDGGAVGGGSVNKDATV